MKLWMYYLWHFWYAMKNIRYSWFLWRRYSGSSLHHQYFWRGGEKKKNRDEILKERVKNKEDLIRENWQVLLKIFIVTLRTDEIDSRMRILIISHKLSISFIRYRHRVVTKRSLSEFMLFITICQQTFDSEKKIWIP